MTEKLPEGWKRVKFIDVAEIIGGGTPSKKRPEYWGGDIDWLTVNDFNSGLKYVRNAKEKITKLGLERSSTKILKKGEIIISARGTVGVTAMLAKDMAFNQSNYGITSKTDATFNDFLYYALKYNISNLKQASYGAVFDTITKSTFETLEILLPPLPEQKAIASVLSSLDDKIDLLRRQNQTLEQMAETLYEYWISDLDFNSTLKDIIAVQNGFAFNSRDFKNDGYHRVIKIKNISGNVVDINSTDFVSDDIISKIDKRFKINSGDVLIAMTGAEIGKMGIVPQTNESLWLNQRVGLLKEKFIGSRFLAYLHLKSDYGADYIENTATGSAQPNISATGIESCEFPKLSNKQLEAYSKQLNLLFNKIIYNLGQISIIENLRDTILPKLMSGEIIVKYQN